jgi:uncharacterized membrane protein
MTISDQHEVQRTYVATSSQETKAIPKTRRWLLVILPPLLLLAFLLFPRPLMEKLRAIGRTVCMLRPDHSFFLAGEQLPLEARTMGMYAGLLLALAYLLVLGRQRATRLPPRWLIAVLVGFIAVMGFDGLNSTAWDIGLPHLYTPSNPLRLITGLLAGVGIAPFLLLAVNASLLPQGQPRAMMAGLGELLGLLAVEAVFFLGVISEAPWLLYPVSLITAGGVVVAFLAITLAVIPQVAPSWGKVADKWKLLSLVNVAMLLTVVELGALLAYKVWIHQCPVPG